MADDKMLTKSQVKERGWTEALIKKYVPVPDKEAVNSYSKKAPIKLYFQKRIEDIEREESFIQLKAKAAIRQISAKKSIAQRKEKFLSEISKYQPEIPVIPKEELFERAKKHYEEINLYKYDKLRNLMNPDDDFIVRISINYIRHELSDYESQLAVIAKKVGVDDAYQIIREKVNEEIIKVYPYLK